MENFKQFMKQNRFFAYGLPFMVCVLMIKWLNVDFTIPVKLITPGSLLGVFVLRKHLHFIFYSCKRLSIELLVEQHTSDA